VDDATLRAAAREHFGWTALHEGQTAAVRALLGGRDVLGILPTGWGKSAIYQLTAVLQEKPTLVVSPLLALQHDQIEGFHHGEAAQLSGEQSAAHQREIIARAAGGELKLLYLTAEQLADPERVSALAALEPALVAVDEAHCVSAWGYDFRPDYLHLGAAIKALGRPPVAALTATASPPVRADIVRWLGLVGPLEIAKDLDRPNITLTATPCVDDKQRIGRLLEVISELPGHGIVYAPTHRITEETTAALREAGLAAEAYHAGLSRAVRDRVHGEFHAGTLPIVVATTAFGMGIDKPDIRWVCHVALPESPDDYLQEIGRAGRDGDPAHAVLLHREEDAGLRRYFASGSLPAREVRQVVDTAYAGSGTFEVGPRRLTAIAALLEQVGAVRTSGRSIRKAPHAPAAERAVELVMEQVDRQKAIRRSRVDMIRNYAETLACRGGYLLSVFGEQLGRLCGHCDNCASGSAAARFTSDAIFPSNSAVVHPEWGRGTVLGYEPDRVVVLFDDVGYRTLSLPDVVARELLRPA